MNLTLGFPEPENDPGLALRRHSGLEGAVNRFREWMAKPDSPVRSIQHQPARDGEFSAIPDSVAPALAASYVARGMDRLYSHQAAAYAEVEAGKNVVVVTPTASGKTLCYNLPVLNRLLSDPAARAMYLFPTKALAEGK